MARFRVENGSGQLAGVVLRDGQTGAWARILPEVGANCVELHLPDLHGGLTSVLYAPESVVALRERPARHGLPVLYPFPNRVRNGQFTFQGITAHLALNQSGHAIHGLVIDQPFSEVARNTADAAELALEIDSRSTARSANYPFPYRLRLNYVLNGQALTLTAVATNIGEHAMPIGYGIHPYFNAPLGTGGARSDCTIAGPTAFGWELDEHLIPTGKHRTLTSEETLTSPVRLSGRSFDNVYGMQTVPGGWTSCVLTDPSSKLALHVESDDQFRELVVYGPATLPAVCFEPYTCTTDAFNLAARGVDSGMRVLNPGESWTGTIRFRLTSA